MRLVCTLFCLWFVVSIVSVDATVVAPAEFTEMVNGSQVIVHGVVTNIRSQLVGPRRTIESVVTLTVIDAIKGERESTAVFRVPGGQVGRYRRVMVGAPQFAEGDEVVVFLAGRPPAVPMPFGLNQGVYRVTRTARGATVTPLMEKVAARVVRGDPARRPLAIEAFAAAVRAAVERSR
jgi:hypothetical protein